MRRSNAPRTSAGAGSTRVARATARCAARVERLLELQGASLAPLEWPTDAPAAPGPVPTLAQGQRIGPWELCECLGRGGMGEVWRARRADGRYERDVALKLVRGGPASPALEARFDRERDVLARLRHANIATLYDAGLDGGRPWLAMELVRGEPIDAYCERIGADLETRVGLVIDVARAVEHAHAELVLHRDIKPSNILVDADGRAVLLDFGIAKLLEEAGTAPEDLTGTEERVLTPRYAGPEALRGENPTPAVDVWSLGVVLHELLTDAHPFAREGERSAGLGLRYLADVQRGLPEAPSAVARRNGRSEAARLEGDLDKILAVALHPDRERRYRTVAQLADDLERWRDGWPVSARPDTLGYRFAKFLRRNRLPVGLAAAAFVALAGGLAFSTREYLRAERARINEREQRELAQKRYADSRRFASGLVFDLTRKVNGLSRITEANAVVLETGVAFLNRLSEDAEDDPVLAYDLVQGYLAIGRERGSLYKVSLGEPVAAREAFERALGLAERLYRRLPESEESLQAFLDAHHALATFEIQWGQWERGIELEEAVLDLCAAHEPLSRFLLRRLAECHNTLAVLYSQTGQHARGIEHLEAALAAYDRVLELWPEGAIFVDGARCTVSLGLVENLALQGRYQDALDIGQPVVARLEASMAAHPPSVSIRRWLGRAHVALASAHEGLGQLNEAARALDAAAEQAEAIVAADPQSDVGLFLEVSVDAERSELAARRGDLEAARTLRRRALDVCQMLAEREPENLNVHDARSAVLRGLATLNVEIGDVEAARACAREAVEAAAIMTRSAPRNVHFAQAHARSLEVLVGVLDSSNADHTDESRAVRARLDELRDAMNASARAPVRPGR